LLRVAGCHGQQDTIRYRLGLGAPAVEMRLVNLVSLSGDHALYRFDDALTIAEQVDVCSQHARSACERIELLAVGRLGK